MGNDQSTRIINPIQKFDIDIVCEKISRHLQLQRDRKINELANKERELAEKVKAKKRSYEDTVIDIGSLVNLLKYITASKIVIRYSQLIKEHSMLIADACKTNNFIGIRELNPYFEGIVWSTDKLNLAYINEFNVLVKTHFRQTDVQEIMKFNKVDKDLRDCFATIEPTPLEIQNYLVEFIKRHQIQDFQWPRGMGPAPTPAQGGNYLPPNYQPNQVPGFGYAPPQPYPGQLPGFNQFPPQGGNFGQPNPNNFPPNQVRANMQGGVENIDDAAIDDLIRDLNFGSHTQPSPNQPQNFGQPDISLPPVVPLNNNTQQQPTGQPTQIPVDNFNQNPGFIENQPKPVQNLPPLNNNVPIGQGLELPNAKGPLPKVKQYATGPEAYTDDKDENCEYGDFEPLILSIRIEEMRKAKV